MMLTRLLAGLVLMSTLADGGAELVRSAGQPSTRLAITHANIVDPSDGRVITDQTILIDGDRIAAVQSSSAPVTGAAVFDARGGYVIPGLWDMHAHVQMSGDSALALYVSNGVTGIRDMGSDLEPILALRDVGRDPRSGPATLAGPRIIAAGPILDDAPEGFPFRLRVRTTEEGAAAVRTLKSAGVDFVKVHDRTPRDAYFAIAAEARRQGLPLAGHVPRGITYEEAIEAGQRSFEHLAGLRLFTPCTGGPGYRPEPCRPFFEMLAARGIWQTPTLLAWRELATIGTPASGVDAAQQAYVHPTLRAAWDGNRPSPNPTPEVVRNFIAASELAATVTRDLVRAGVGVLAGCDGMIPGFCVHDELALMVRGGLSPVEALRSATTNPVRYLEGNAPGSPFSAGRSADLVVLEANPLADIANTRRIRAVILRGQLLHRDALDRLLDSARAAAAAASK